MSAFHLPRDLERPPEPPACASCDGEGYLYPPDEPAYPCARCDATGQRLPKEAR